VDSGGTTTTIPLATDAISDQSAPAAQELLVTWDGGWHATVVPTAHDASTTNVACAPAEASLRTYLNDHPGVQMGSSSGTEASTLNPLDGCLLTWEATGAGNVTQTSDLLYHDGVLLATTATARAVFSLLPAASAHELALARTIAANQ
jgi:hypothetical protein